MAQNLRVVYNDSDKTIIGFLGDDLNKDEHEANSPDGVKVTDNILTFDDDDEIITLDKVIVNSDGVASKV